MSFNSCCVDIILIMKNHSAWFQSPFPKACNFYNPQPNRLEHENQLDQSQWIKPIYFSPQPEHTLIRPSQNINQLSPWSKLINSEPESKSDFIVISGLIPEQHEFHGGIDQKLVYSGDQDQDPVTPMKSDFHCKEQVEEGQLHTTGRKSQFEPVTKKSRPREKGLRKLSQRAYEIVQEMRNATYKEVAAKLVLQLNEQEFQGENKQQQNIKRRVYDALNVLIALGVLKKEGRRIVSERGNKKGSKISVQSEQIYLLRQKLQKRVELIQDKKKQLKQTQDKLKFINNIFMRNKQKSQPCDKRFIFPFIGMCASEKEIQNSRLIKQQVFIIRFKQPTHPFGDIDSLKWLKESFQNLHITNETKDLTDHQQQAF